MNQSQRRSFIKLGSLLGAVGAMLLGRGSAAAAGINVWSSGDDRITYDDATNTFQFRVDGKPRMDITEDADNAVIALNGHGTIRSNGDLRVHLDQNQDAGYPSASAFQIFNGSNSAVFSVNETGELSAHGGQIFTVIRDPDLNRDDGKDNYLIVSTGQMHRGRVEIRNQPEVTQEFAQPGKAGILVLYDEGGRANFLWVDSNGKLRISRSDPGTNDLTGMVVGMQS
jgi:hypothetical protein